MHNSADYWLMVLTLKLSMAMLALGKSLLCRVLVQRIKYAIPLFVSGDIFAKANLRMIKMYVEVSFPIIQSLKLKRTEKLI